MKGYLVVGGVLLSAVVLFAAGCESCNLGKTASCTEACPTGVCPTATTAFVEPIGSESCGVCGQTSYGVSSGPNFCGCSAAPVTTYQRTNGSSSTIPPSTAP